MYNTHISPYTTKPVEQAEVREGQVLSKMKYSMHHFEGSDNGNYAYAQQK